MIYVATNSDTITTQGTPARLTAEMGAVMISVWRNVRQQVHNDQLALSMIVNMVKDIIEHEKIKPTEIIEAIRSVEEYEANEMEHLSGD